MTPFDEAQSRAIREWIEASVRAAKLSEARLAAQRAVFRVAEDFFGAVGPTISEAEWLADVVFEAMEDVQKREAEGDAWISLSPDRRRDS